jgi:hypothetical protein
MCSQSSQAPDFLLIRVKLLPSKGGSWRREAGRAERHLCNVALIGIFSGKFECLHTAPCFSHEGEYPLIRQNVYKLMDTFHTLLKS